MPSNTSPDTTAASSDGNAAETKASSRSWADQGLGVVIVVLVLVIFVAFAVWTAIGAGSKDWSGRVLILGPIETLAAAALGWYFGSAVQRERVAQAEARELQAARDAANGRALAALVLAREGRIVENDAGSTLVDTRAAADQTLRREYADAARLLFPYSLGRTRATDEATQRD